MAQGYKAYLGIAEETTWGTKVVTGMDFAEFTNEKIKKTVEEILTKGINASRSHKRRLQGKVTVNGDFSFEVNADDIIGLILKHALHGSSAPVQQGVTAAWKHTFTPLTSFPVGLTVQVGRDDAVFDYFGGKITQIKFDSKVGEILLCSVSIVAKDGDIGTSQSPTYSTVQPFIFHQGVFKVGGVENDIQSFEFAINNNLKVDRRKLGSKLIIEPKPGVLLVNGSFKQFFSGAGSGSAYDKFVNGASASLELTFTGALIASTYYYTLYIKLPEVYYNGEDPNVGSADADIEQNVPFTAIYNATDTNEIKLELTNTRTTIY